MMTRKIVFILSYMMLLLGCGKNEPVVNPYNGRTSAQFNSSLEYGSLIDQEGNSYKTIKIGNQVWMAENLRTTLYNDGSEIPTIADSITWYASVDAGACCTYKNTQDIDTISTYGRLYNWAAVNSGKLAPKGWHIPTNIDWDSLTAQLSPIRDDKGIRIDGGKLKEVGTTHWLEPNLYANNRTGFTALPAGARFAKRSFAGFGWYGGWWSSTLEWDVWVTFLVHNYGAVCDDAINLGNGVNGFSVRCVKDK